jgi:hypothetical protein
MKMRTAIPSTLLLIDICPSALAQQATPSTTSQTFWSDLSP